MLIVFVSFAVVTNHNTTKTLKRNIYCAKYVVFNLQKYNFLPIITNFAKK